MTDHNPMGAPADPDGTPYDTSHLRTFDRRVSNTAYCRSVRSVWASLVEGRRWWQPCVSRGCMLDTGHDGPCTKPSDTRRRRKR
jgi:hypothetical protein